jgi:hypothetical protein
MLISVLALSFFSIAAGKPPGHLPVISILEGNLPGDYRIMSDLGGPYLNGSGGVESILQIVGDWELDTEGHNPTRMVFLDFRDQVLNSGATPPFDTGLVFGRFIAKSTDTGLGTIRAMTGLESQILSPLVFAFGYGTERYRIAMNPLNFPETNYVLVTCTGVSGSGPAAPCNAWAIEPSVTQPDGEHKNIAQLLGISTKRGKIVETDLGDFYLSFRITITTQ